MRVGSNGEVYGNPLLNYGVIDGSGGQDPGADWNKTLFHYAGAFDEMFGTHNPDYPDNTNNLSYMS